jgi:pimeloyl-ACP methyl ester carboxylesterase
VRVPSLVVQGEDDPYGTLAQLDAIERHSGGPVTRLVLPRCGHAPHRDRLGEVEGAAVAFVAGLQL